MRFDIDFVKLCFYFGLNSKIFKNVDKPLPRWKYIMMDYKMKFWFDNYYCCTNYIIYFYIILTIPSYYLSL